MEDAFLDLYDFFSVQQHAEFDFREVSYKNETAFLDSLVKGLFVPKEHIVAVGAARVYANTILGCSREVLYLGYAKKGESDKKKFGEQYYRLEEALSPKETGTIKQGLDKKVYQAINDNTEVISLGRGLDGYDRFLIMLYDESLQTAPLGNLKKGIDVNFAK
jgi:hypothetical protein